MASISKQQTQIHITEESTAGSTPESATWPKLRFSNDGFGVQGNQVVDPTINTERVPSASQRVGLENRGTISMVLREDDGIEMLMEGVMGDEWTTNSLAVDSTKQTYSIVKRFDSGELYPQAWRGVLVNGFTLDIPDEGIITIDWDLQGGEAPDSTEPTLKTYSSAAPANTKGMLASNASLSWTGTLGASIGSAYVTSLSLAYTNNADAVKVIGTEGEPETNLGQAGIEGRATIFFEDASLYTGFLNQTSFGVTAVCNDDAASASYTFTVNSTSAVLKEFALPVEGNSGSLIANVAFDVFDVSGSNLTIDRSA